MNRSRFLAVFLAPSLLSATLTLLFACALVAGAFWSVSTEQQLLPSLLPTDGTIPTLQTALFNSMASYQLLLVVCAIGVGVGVYVLIRSVSGLAHESSEALEELQSTDPTVHRSFLETFRRLVLRVLGLAGWVVYAMLFLRVILPFCVMLAKQGTQTLDDSISVALLTILGSLFLAALCAHVHIIFMRLCFMRLRMFGGIDTALYSSSR